MPLVLPPTYLPDIHWFAAAAQAGQVTVGCALPYAKQTALSRTLIKSANGPLLLCAQVTRASRHQPVADAVLSFKEPWHKLHTRAIRSAYGRCAFFEHYGEPLLQLLGNPPQRLLALNMALITLMGGWLQLPIVVLEDTIASLDYPLFQVQPYFQPFGPFEPHLSVVDVLMNLGPEALPYLRALQPVENESAPLG
jgi:hypothetical protein